MANPSASRSRLNSFHLPQFAGDTLFDRLGRAVCEAECLPRKELFEAWEVAKRVRRRVRGHRVVDVAAGHGLAAFALLLLDDTSPGAVCVDVRKPLSFERLEKVLVAHWPRLAGRVQYVEGRLESVPLLADDLVVCVHGCRDLTDHVIDRALAAGCSDVALLPCCHPEGRGDLGGLEGWLDRALAIDVVRAMRLRQAGYEVHTAQIPAEITPKNRLLLAERTASAG